MIKIQAANHELPSVTTYPLTNFLSLRLLLHFPLSVRVPHAPVSANRNVPHRPLSAASTC